MEAGLADQVRLFLDGLIWTAKNRTPPLPASSGRGGVAWFCVMATYLLVALGANALTVDGAVQGALAAEERHQIESGKWLIRSPLLTSKEISDKIGLSETTTHLVFPIRGYYGRARSDIWEWLAAKS